MKKLGILGTSGMAREVGDIAWSMGYDPFYIAKSAEELKEWNGSENVVLEECLEEIGEVVLAIGIGDSNIRRTLAKKYANKFEFINLIHPSVTLGKGQLELIHNESTGVIIAAGAALTNSITIGNFTIINQNVTVAHDCSIGNFVHLAPGSNISGNVRIEDEAWIGAGAVINQGSNESKLKVGHSCIVGSGSVVVRDCQSNSVYVGVPARKVS